MDLTNDELIVRVTDVMANKGMLDRPVTPNEVAEICRMILRQSLAERPVEYVPKFRKRLIPDQPDEESAKQAMWDVMRPRTLINSLRNAVGCYADFLWLRARPELVIVSAFARQAAILRILAEFGIYAAPRRLPRRSRKPGACKLQMFVPLPEEWRELNPYFESLRA